MGFEHLLWDWTLEWALKQYSCMTQQSPAHKGLTGNPGVVMDTQKKMAELHRACHRERGAQTLHVGLPGPQAPNGVLELPVH
jgi:hypothetical protein